MTGDTPMQRAIRRAREALDAWESIPDVDPPGVEEAAMANALRDLVKHAELREQEHDHALNTILAQQNQIADLETERARLIDPADVEALALRDLYVWHHPRSKWSVKHVALGTTDFFGYATPAEAIRAALDAPR